MTDAETIARIEKILRSVLVDEEYIKPAVDDLLGSAGTFADGRVEGLNDAHTAVREWANEYLLDGSYLTTQADVLDKALSLIRALARPEPPAMEPLPPHCDKCGEPHGGEGCPYKPTPAEPAQPTHYDRIQEELARATATAVEPSPTPASGASEPTDYRELYLAERKLRQEENERWIRRATSPPAANVGEAISLENIRSAVNELKTTIANATNADSCSCIKRIHKECRIELKYFLTTLLDFIAIVAETTISGAAEKETK